MSPGTPGAATKLPPDSPCRYRSGSTPVIIGIFRGGKLAVENRFRPQCPGRQRLSLTRGDLRGRAAQTWHLPRLASRCRPPGCGPTCPAGGVRRDAGAHPGQRPASIRRAPSRTISSISDSEPSFMAAFVARAVARHYGEHRVVFPVGALTPVIARSDPAPGRHTLYSRFTGLKHCVREA